MKLYTKFIFVLLSVYMLTGCSENLQENLETIGKVVVVLDEILTENEGTTQVPQEQESEPENQNETDFPSKEVEQGSQNSPNTERNEPEKELMAGRGNNEDSIPQETRSQQSPVLIPQMGDSIDDLMGYALPGEGPSWIKYSDTGKTIITYRDRSVKVWDVNSGSILKTFSTPFETSYQDIALSPNGRILAFVTYGRQKGELNNLTDDEFDRLCQEKEITMHVVLSDIYTGEKIYSFPTEGDCDSIISTNLMFSQDGSAIAVIFPSKMIQIFNAQTGQLMSTFEGESSKIFISPDLQCIAHKDSKGVIKVVDINTKEDILTFNNLDDVSNLIFSPNRELIVTEEAGERPFLNLWNAKTDRFLVELAKQGTSIVFSNDSKYIAFLDNNNWIHLWDIEKNKTIQVYGEHRKKIIGLSFSPDGAYLAGQDADSAIEIWQVVPNKSVNKVSQHESIEAVKTMTGFSSNAITVAAMDSNAPLAACGMSDGKILLWDLQHARIGHILSGHTYPQFSSSDNAYIKGIANSVQSLTFIPDTPLLMSRGADTIKLWDTTSGQEVSVNQEQIEKFTVFGMQGFAFSPKQGVFAISRGLSGTPEQPKDAILLGRLGTPEALYTFKESESHITSLAFNADGHQLAVAEQTSPLKMLQSPSEVQHKSVITIWDINTHKKVLTIFDSPDVLIFNLQFSPDGKYLASFIPDNNREENTIKIWEISTGKVLHTIPGDFVTAIRFSSDSQRLVGSGAFMVRVWDVVTGERLKDFQPTDRSKTLTYYDGTNKVISGIGSSQMRLWDIETEEKLATFTIIDNDGYLVHTSDNYYLASKKDLKDIGFTIGDKTYPFEQFDVRLNRPDKVLQKIGYASQEVIAHYRAAYEKRMGKMKFQFGEEQLGDNFHVPEIAILNQGSLPLSTGKKQISLQVKADDSKYLLDRLNVYVNDVPIYGIRGMDFTSRQTSHDEQEVIIELSNGNNKIQVSVHNQQAVESLKETVYIKYDGKQALPNLYFVGIGVAEYEDGRDLLYVDQDVHDLVQLYKNQEGNMFHKVFDYLLINEDVQKEKIPHVKQFLQHSTVDDMVIVFFSGHGILDKYENYFSTYDWNYKQPSLRGISYTELEDVLDAIPARKKVLLINACHSGEGDEDMETFLEMQRIFADLRRGSGSTIISSARGDQSSFTDIIEKYGENSAFGYMLLNALNGKKAQNGMAADANSDFQITVTELKYYLEKEIEEMKGHSNPQPTLRRENLEHDFVVWSEIK